ncbi:helix-turn-helix domain-containing protein [Nonomuraea angiospora]|uniref:DNA-binding Xre family transcriptional regulator n=1 Tax=Nonomuraea angiospora TaxID=46172 RepID=A0ABR9MHA5_9ACTN|nr:helix-turn-helix transcriptional regulator [Nonomuraea angiospora]MBE1592321.1 DNA-binding Xre family transcriptional regulator [Nonomuraea angiospora]
MRWNLRLAAANRGIWKASELQRMPAEHGLTISAGKMSGLWPGEPASIKLDDLNVICAVLGCGVEELLIPEPDKVRRVDDGQDQQVTAAVAGGPPVVSQAEERSLSAACVTCRRDGFCMVHTAAWTAWPGESSALADARPALCFDTVTRAARANAPGAGGRSR